MAQGQFITFKVGAEEYGVDVISIREIKGWTATTDLPDEPSFMRGVIDLRGVIVPILDLRARLGGGTTEASPRHVIIVLSVHGQMVGMLVDAVADILTVDESDIRPVPDMDVSRTHATVLRGILPLEDRMVAILDPNVLFTHQPTATAEILEPASCA